MQLSARAETEHQVSEKTSRAIFDDAVAAYRDPAHPCHLFRQLQPGVPDAEWELPEPFNGHSAKAGIVFLGLNPSYDPAEAVPRIGCSFEEWDVYYRARFDTAPTTWHKLYRRYQRIGELASGPEFRLGADGVVVEMIRFRSVAGQGCQDPGVLAHELPTTRRLLSDLQPRVIVANGGDALWAVQQLWPAIQSSVPVGSPLHSVEHTMLEVEAEWGRTVVLPTRHLSAAFGYRTAMLDTIADRVRSFFEAR